MQQDTGLRPGSAKTPIYLYATSTAWEARFGSGARVAGLYLPDTHGGRPALHRLFALTAAGTPFADAFAGAFGLTQDEFQAEYLDQVNGHRPAPARP